LRADCRTYKWLLNWQCAYGVTDPAGRPGCWRIGSKHAEEAEFHDSSGQHRTGYRRVFERGRSPPSGLAGERLTIFGQRVTFLLQPVQ